MIIDYSLKDRSPISVFARTPHGLVLDYLDNPRVLFETARLWLAEERLQADASGAKTTPAFGLVHAKKTGWSAAAMAKAGDRATEVLSAIDDPESRLLIAEGFFPQGQEEDKNSVRPPTPPKPPSGGRSLW